MTGVFAVLLFRLCELVNINLTLVEFGATAVVFGNLVLLEISYGLYHWA